MRHAILTLLLCLHLLMPIAVQAAEAVKGPLDVTLKQYFFFLAVALLGGFVSWFGKVRRGELAAASLMHLIGELSTSAMAGLLAFWVMQWLQTPDMLQAAIVGVAGHMGAKFITWLESVMKRRAELAMGLRPEIKDPQ
jgi:hypothetical protein